MVIAPLQSADCKTRTDRERRFPLLGFSSLFVNIEKYGKQEIKVDDNVDVNDDQISTKTGRTPVNGISPLDFAAIQVLYPL